MTPLQEKIISIEQAIQVGKRIDGKTAWQMMEKATDEGKTLRMIWKVPNQAYQKWFHQYEQACITHNQKPITTIEDETTYIVFSGEKAFDWTKGGYSIFARSLGSMKRGNLPYEIDRIEHLTCEWAIIY